MATPNGTKSTAKPAKLVPPPTAPATETAETAPAAKTAKAHSNSTRDNSFLKWKPSTMTRLQHVKERFPDVAKHVDEVLKVVATLPDDYSPNPDVAVKVGDTVRLPEHASMLAALKLENKAQVIEVSRGKAKVQVGTHQFTVATSEVEIIARGK
jgi:hypothetical protein